MVEITIFVLICISVGLSIGLLFALEYIKRLESKIKECESLNTFTKP